jgi:hypothetical protein
MFKGSPKYMLHFRWGNFQLRIVGKGPILCWGGLLGLLAGLKVLGPKLIGLF